MKQRATLDEQINTLVSHGVTFDLMDEEKARRFLYFKDGTAYFDRGVSKAGELCDNPYLRSLHCVWKRNSQIAGWRGWELGVDTPFDSRKYRRLEEDEQLRLLKQFLDEDDLRHVKQIAEAGDSGLVADLVSILETVHASLEELE